MIEYRELTSRAANVRIGGEIRSLTSERAKFIRDAEDRAFNQPTDKNFGFARLKTPPDWSRELVLTNGDGAGLERKMNCQRCVVAHEARMRGYDVVARPSWGFGDPTRRVGEWLKAFDYSPDDFQKCAGSTGAELLASAKRILYSFGENSRAIVILMSKDKINGHAAVAEYRGNGVFNFGDPQTKSRAALKELNQAKVGSVKLMRTDNLDFTDLIKRCCMNRGASMITLKEAVQIAENWRDNQKVSKAGDCGDRWAFSYVCDRGLLGGIVVMVNKADGFCEGFGDTEFSNMVQDGEIPCTIIPLPD